MARILVIDDEQPVRDMMRQMLEDAGYQVDEADNGDDGVRAFGLRPADLVITDILMPKKGGRLAIKEIREHCPQAPIIAMSGGGRTGRLNFLSTAQTFSGVRTLRKPFRRTELLAMVEELLAA